MIDPRLEEVKIKVHREAHTRFYKEAVIKKKVLGETFFFRTWRN